MEMKHPLIPIIGIAITAVLLIITYFIPSKKGDSFRGGIRAANTNITKELPYYKGLILKRRLLIAALITASVSSIVSSCFLLARPYSVRNVSNGVKRRDIFLCLDVSYSLYSLNYDLTDYLVNIVRGLDGDRFGITIFNTSSIVYVPMTDDYDYIIQRLDELKEYFSLQREFEEKFSAYTYLSELTDEEYAEYNSLYERLHYFEAGTLVNNYTRGSSLIGEGLASCLYSFPSIDDSQRTRVIIFATDNANAALVKEIVTLPEACNLCAKNDVTVFGIFPDSQNYYYTEYTEKDYEGFAAELSRCVKSTGGEFYVEGADRTVADIVSQIQKHKAMTVDEIISEQVTDEPFLPYVILFISLSALCACGIALKI